jgi:CBS domain containing-hemolysin-like protein
VLLVAANSFFVAAEFAIVKVRVSQLEIKAQTGNPFAILGRRVIAHLDGYLAATQLGITLASLGLGWIGEPVVSKLILAIMHALGVGMAPETAHTIALPVAFVTITVLHIVFGELAPKSIAIQRSEATTLAIVYPLHLFYILFRPFIWLLNGLANTLLGLVGIMPVHETEIHSSEELKYLVRQGSDFGTIESGHYDLIRNAFDFSERTVKQIMIPRSRMLAIDIDAFDEGALERIISEGYSRIPCYEDNPDHIVGVVHLKHVLIGMLRKQSFGIRDVLRPVLFVPETKRIGELLKEFQEQHEQLAVVVDEFGGTQGIITMEDILEELVGEIQDESDFELQSIERVDDRTFLIHASAALGDINRELPRPLPREGQSETLAGYLLYQFGRVPNTNDSIVSDGYEFTVTKMNRTAIVQARLRDLSEPDPDGI